VSEKERDEFYKLERYKNVDEYDAVLRWHCRLDEPKPEKKTEGMGPQIHTDERR